MWSEGLFHTPPILVLGCQMGDSITLMRNRGWHTWPAHEKVILRPVLYTCGDGWNPEHWAEVTDVATSI